MKAVIRVAGVLGLLAFILAMIGATDRPLAAEDQIGSTVTWYAVLYTVPGLVTFVWAIFDARDIGFPRALVRWLIVVVLVTVGLQVIYASGAFETSTLDRLLDLLSLVVPALTGSAIGGISRPGFPDLPESLAERIKRHNDEVDEKPLPGGWR